MKEVCNTECHSEAMSAINSAISKNASAKEALHDAMPELKSLQTSVSSSVASGFTMIPLDDLQPGLPEDQNPDCLFHGGFLIKGGVLVLAAPSGVGKSVITMQFAYAWTLGRKMLGIEPWRPIKIGIFQTEDSPEDMAEFRNSMAEGYKRCYNWTDNDIAKAEHSIFVANMNGYTGSTDEFLSNLRSTQLANKFDLIIINPLQGVTDFDISDNEKMREFLRKKLDGIIKAPETKCAVMFVHHTTKPQMQQRGAGGASDRYAQYGLAGASELTNVMRAMLAIDPTNERDQYKLVAAKRGKRLNWPVSNDSATKPTRIIRQSTKEENMLFWHEVGSETTKPLPQKAPSTEEDAEEFANALKLGAALPLTDARKKAQDMFSSERGKRAYDEVRSKPDKYGLAIQQLGGNKKVIGSIDAIKNSTK